MLANIKKIYVTLRLEVRVMKKGYIYDTPIGNVCIVESERGICQLSFSSSITDVEVKQTPLLQKTYQQLLEYFAGKRSTFSVPLDIKGTTFQIRTWRALLSIGYGETWSYKQYRLYKK